MSDSDSVTKSLKAYHDAKALGASNGSAAGQLGADAWRSDRQPKANPIGDYWERRHREEAEARKAAQKRRMAAQDDGAKVICTELHRQGLMSRADYLLCAQHARAHLSERHFRGYHAWALPVVRMMRRSKWATAFWRGLAQARADHIAYLAGDISRRNRPGAFLCTVGHAACYLIGGFVRDRDWQALYAGQSAGV